MAITAKVLQLGVPLITAFHVTRLAAVLLLTEPLFLHLYEKTGSSPFKYCASSYIFSSNREQVAPQTVSLAKPPHGKKRPPAGRAVKAATPLWQ